MKRKIIVFLIILASLIGAGYLVNYFTIEPAPAELPIDKDKIKKRGEKFIRDQRMKVVKKDKKRLKEYHKKAPKIEPQ